MIFRSSTLGTGTEVISSGKKNSDLESSSSLGPEQQAEEPRREGWIRIGNFTPRVLAIRNPDLQRDWENPNELDGTRDCGNSRESGAPWPLIERCSRARREVSRAAEECLL
jgi:hypothetical protein